MIGWLIAVSIQLNKSLLSSGLHKAID